MRLSPVITLTAAFLTVLAFVGPADPKSPTDGAPPGRAPGHCSRERLLDVPGAAHQRRACLADLTTAALAGTAYTDTADQAGLSAAGTRNPSGVPGVQVDGYFPDDSHGNATHGWLHDSQFVIRLPDHWNGGLVVTGSPGSRGSTPRMC